MAKRGRPRKVVKTGRKAQVVKTGRKAFTPNNMAKFGSRRFPINAPHYRYYRERALVRLNAQIAQLTDLLSLEKTGKVNL